MVVVERAVHLSADPAHHAAVAAGQEQLRLAVLEEGVSARAQEQPPLELERGHPLRRASMEAEREVDELAPIAPSSHRSDLDGHGGAP